MILYMNFKLLTSLNEEFKTRLVRSHITNVVLINSATLLLSSSYIKDEKILISLEPSSPYIYFVKIDESPLTINNGLSQMLRHYIKDSYIADISVENEDSIIKFNLRMRVEENTYVDYFMFIELIKKQARIIITDSSNRILLATHYSKKDDKRKILVNNIYNYPERQIVFNNDYDIDAYKLQAKNIYEKSLLKRRKEKYKDLFHFIDSKINILSKKFNILEDEINEGENCLRYKEYGDCCLYMTKEEVYDILDADNIKYDNQLTLIDLSKYFYKKYKKSKTKISTAKEQISLCFEQLQYFKYIKSTIDNLQEEELDSLCFSLLNKKTETRKNDKIKKAKEPYKITHLNTEFLFGKNAEQNHNLTFHKTRDTDTFVHIHNYPGSHIIIRNDNPTKEQLLFASSMALILSNKLSGEVDYAKIKDVKSTTTTGLVVLKKYQTIKINDIDINVKKFISEAKK